MNTVELNSINLQSIDIASNNVSSIGKFIKRNNKPYIKGHITTSDNTFTFKINNTDTSVSVDANGNFKYKPTSTITSLSFVGVPQLESLELFAINGVTTFDVDYPTNVTFIKCDSTTISAKNDVYHIRGTATEDFDFTLKYIDDNDNVTEVTESAVIDGNGKWDVAYSGKLIKDLNSAFFESAITTIEFTEELKACTNTYRCISGSSSGSPLKVISLPYATLENTTTIEFGFRYLTNIETFYAPKLKLSKATTARSLFYNSTSASLEKLDLSSVTFSSLLTNPSYMFYGVKAKEINIKNVDFSNVNDLTDIFAWASNLKDLYVPQNSTLPISINLRHCPLSYESMLRVVGWLKDLTDGTAQTVTFRKATYDALTAEQQAALTAIIVTQKGWNLATA